jgi:GR25 family glycosyltransferase involved in LPS biosynthesis
MPKLLNKQTLLIIGVFVLVLIVLYAINSYVNQFRANIKTIHVINLDRDEERWANIKNSTTTIALPVERWTATYGKDLTPDQMADQGVGYAMTSSGKGPYSNRGDDRRNQGVVGCFISHKTLLENLAAMDVPEYYGHLILEDDIVIPKNLLTSDGAWASTYQNIPLDWDVVYLDVVNPKGKSLGNNLMKLSYKRGGNWGTHAYIVRHGSIKKKILPWLAHMMDAIDEQYNRKFSTWNVYAVVPGIISLDPVLSCAEKSSIQQM